MLIKVQEQAPQHFHVILPLWATDLCAPYRLIGGSRRLFISSFTQCIQLLERERYRLCLTQAKLVNAKSPENSLAVQNILQRLIALSKKYLILFLCQPQILCQVQIFLRSGVPKLDAAIYIGKITLTAQILLLKIHSLHLLFLLFFLPKGKLPIIKPFIIRIPGQPTTCHSIFSGHQIDLRCPIRGHLVTVLIHIMSLNDLLSAILCQQCKQRIQLACVVCAGNRRKSPVCQAV